MFVFTACGEITADKNTQSDSLANSSQNASDSKENSQSSNGGVSNAPNSSSENKPVSSSVNNSISSNTNTTSSSNQQTSQDPVGEVVPVEKQGDIWLSPNGSDQGTGTRDNPLYSISVAVSRAVAGTTIFCEPGSYNCSQRVNLSNSGTQDKPITIQAYNWGEVVFDFTNQPYGKNDSNYVGFFLSGSYWKIQGITICHAGDNAIKVEGSYNYIGRCVTHHNGDTGIQLGFGHTTKNPNGTLCAYNIIENCDSYLNYDFDNHGDADGFACKMHNGKGNKFIGCRAWRNCDDAWDLFETDWSVEIINCWAWESGKKEDFINDEFYSDPAYLAKKGVSRPTMAGNGNGIKLGGNGTGGSSKGTHVVKNCVSFGHNISTSVKGFDENNHTDGNILENCVSWDNGYNFMFENSSSATRFENCISFYTNDGNKSCKPGRLAGEIKAGVVVNCNFFNDGGDLMELSQYKAKITKDDFISCREEDAKAPRQADGSLPDNGFAKLKPTSILYGTGMGLLG